MKQPQVNLGSPKSKAVAEETFRKMLDLYRSIIEQRRNPETKAVDSEYAVAVFFGMHRFMGAAAAFEASSLKKIGVLNLDTYSTFAMREYLKGQRSVAVDTRPDSDDDAEESAKLN